MPSLAGANVAALERERDELENRRHGVDLWRDPQAAALLLQAVDQMDRVIDRLARLQAIRPRLAPALSALRERKELSRLGERLQRHAGYVAQAHRELVAIGPDRLP